MANQNSDFNPAGYAALSNGTYLPKGYSISGGNISNANGEAVSAEDAQNLPMMRSQVEAELAGTATKPGTVQQPGTIQQPAPGGPAGSAPLPVAPTIPGTAHTDPVSPPKPSAGPAATPNNPVAPPTPFQTNDPLAFMPLPVAAGQMAPQGAGGTLASPSPTPTSPTPTPTGGTGGPTATTTPAPPPAQWSYNGPRTQQEILQQDYHGNYDAFLAASPNASISALGTDPGVIAARNAGNTVGSNGAQFDATGKQVAGPNAALAATEAAPYIQAGINPNGTPVSAPPPYATRDANGLPALPPMPNASTPSPVNVPTPIQAPMPWERPVGSTPNAGNTLPSAGAPSAAITPNANGLPVAPANASNATAPTTPSPAASTVTPASASPSASTPTTDANGLPTTSGAMSAGNAVNLTPATPSNSLTNMTIAPGQLADRYGIAQTKLQSLIHDTLDPQFAADNRDSIRSAAAAGAIGSGQLNTSLGDILARRTHDINSASTSFLGNALNSSIDDAYKNVGIAQQQQNFQQNQQNTGFNQQVTLQQLSDSELGQQFSQLMTTLGFNSTQMQQAFENAYKVQQLSDDETGQSFYRALQQFIAGTSGDPAQIQAWLAGQYARPTSAAA